VHGFITVSDQVEERGQRGGGHERRGGVCPLFSGERGALGSPTGNEGRGKVRIRKTLKKQISCRKTRFTSILLSYISFPDI